MWFIYTLFAVVFSFMVWLTKGMVEIWDEQYEEWRRKDCDE